MYRVQAALKNTQTGMWGISVNNIRTIKTVCDAKEALSLLAQRKYQDDLATIRRLAQKIANDRGGNPGREEAIRAVLIGFSDNVETLEQAS